VRRIGKRSSELEARAIRTAEQIERIDARSARWIAPDALRELRSDPVRARAQTR
jgi:3-methyladenine DNA glycosylase AlkD